MKWLLLLLTLVLIVVHQDFWNWGSSQPLAFGFLPIGLWYHALFCIAAAILLAMFVMFLWPKDLESVEREVPQDNGPETAGH
jgi:hypothetical protein